MKLNPVGDHFILVPDEAAEETKGGIVMPEAAQEKPRTGKVIAVGEGRYNSLRGEYVGMPVAPGDHIVYKPFAGMEIELTDEKGSASALLLKSEDIFAIIVN